jgi:hypothetical protein
LTGGMQGVGDRWGVGVEAGVRVDVDGLAGHRVRPPLDGVPCSGARLGAVDVEQGDPGGASAQRLSPTGFRVVLWRC